MITSLHSSSTLGRTLNMKANKTVITAKKIIQSTVWRRAVGNASGLKNGPAAEIPAFTDKDVSKNKPAPSTTANERNRAFTTLNTLRAVLQVVSLGTLQMV